MNIIEQLVEAKSRDGRESEDVIFSSPAYAAVIDGATDKTGRTFAGLPGGLFAARSILRTIASLDAGLDIRSFVDGLSQGLLQDIARAAPGFDPRTDDGPSATVVVYSPARREVWRVGDASWAADGAVHLGDSPIDRATASARAAFLRARIIQGVPVERLRAHDEGRAFIRPLLDMQHAFRNVDAPDEPFGFGAIDGRPVPDRYLEAWPVPDAVEIILASDGYPALFPTLSQTEAQLCSEIERDPLRIGRFPATKAVAPDATSFDDRAYLRLSVKA